MNAVRISECPVASIVRVSCVKCDCSSFRLRYMLPGDTVLTKVERLVLICSECRFLVGIADVMKEVP